MFIIKNLKMNNFKSKYNFDARYKEATDVLDKYPDKIPIIVEKNRKSNDIPTLDKIKFLVPKDLTIGQLLYVIRKRMTLSPEKALFVFIKNILPPTSMTVYDAYLLYKDDDNFLYITYSGENSFGV